MGCVPTGPSPAGATTGGPTRGQADSHHPADSSTRSPPAASSTHHRLWGLRTDGTITCWGSNNRLRRPADSSTRSPPAGNIRLPTTITWPQPGQADAPGGQFSTVTAASGAHSCGIRTDGTITCWGYNEWGQATGRLTHRPGGQFNTVTAGDNHTCGLGTDGTITCWGGNRDGQADTPGGQFNTVTAGDSHTCGLPQHRHVWLQQWDTYRRDHHLLGHTTSTGRLTYAPGGQFNTVTAGAPFVWVHTEPCGAGTVPTGPAQSPAGAYRQPAGAPADPGRLTRPADSSTRSPPAGAIRVGCVPTGPSPAGATTTDGQADTPGGQFNTVTAGDPTTRVGYVPMGPSPAGASRPPCARRSRPGDFHRRRSSELFYTATPRYWRP